ncbi:hypothetical protein Clacol_007146 [Clathrus columnatus]|uniref:Peptidase S53 domain-containing protein n=1 Tax=Clathrus columnatus TaxID=1419009 RepID=A0AAV5AF62_9AGAM|nr:hypothetical protein Clacol_007146 [Clathrus columnatus]
MVNLSVQLLILSFSVIGIWASPSLHSRVIHEKREHVPHGWERSRKLDGSTILPMRFGLKQSNIDRLEELLMDVSHPHSPNYGKHWSPERIAETFAPTQDSVDSVIDWLDSEGLGRDRIKLSNSKGWIQINATVEEVERLLNAEYHVYTHIYGNQHIASSSLACDSYSVPAHIQEHVDIILPTVNFDAKVPPPRTASSLSRRAQRQGATINSFAKSKGKVELAVNAADPLATCNEQITPACLRALYNFTYTFVATNENSYGIVGSTPTLVSIDGGVAQTKEQSFDFNGESDLDLEYGMTLVNPQKVTLYQAGDLVEGASFNNLLDALDGSYCTFDGGDDPTEDGIYPDKAKGGFDEPESCGIAKPANVISTSYGSQEPEMTASYQIRQCNEYGKLGMMGVTILYSSGDNGVGGPDVCINPRTGKETASGTRFDPVGATQINPNATVNDPESACEQVIFSGGGFSDIFALPSYQAEAVTSFLTNHPPPYTAQQFNNSGKARGYPDLAANGANYIVGIDDGFELVFGTSCSSPVVGSLITAINDARLAVGKSPVGFINPTIYLDSFQSGFNDITMGGNQGCGTPGFTSVEGWDPVTGLGTPNFGKLLELWLALP